MEVDVSNRTKIIFYIIIFLVAGILLYSVFTRPKDEPPVIYEYDFDNASELDDDFLLVSSWGEYSHNPSLVALRDGVLVMDSSRNEAPQYILTAPIDMSPGSVIKITRKVKINRGTKLFSGGMALFQTNDMERIPAPVNIEESDLNNGWFSRMGDAVVLVEYSYDLIHEEKRPGKDVFRMLCADWELNDNFTLIPPIYDKWIEEELVFDMRVNKVSYSIDGKKYSLNSLRPDKSAFRLLMHSYGLGEGNILEIDNLKIEVEDKSFRK